jgi:hypothetical protein
MASVALGLLSVMVLCLPFVGVAAVGLSGLGVLLGLSGLFKSFGQGAARLGGPAGGAGGVRRFGEGTRDFPLAGVGVCLLALALTILPWILH